MQKNILDKRLSAAAALVPNGARVADIGSDHAYLPIQLALSGRIKCALASDINDGPVEAARKNILMHGVSDRVTAQRADGLDGVESFSPDCITVLGMGGELIIKILDRAPWIKRSGIRLVLQPMTHSELLSKYLCESGFEIVDEAMVRDGERSDRIYRIIAAEYTGNGTELTEAEHLVGRFNLERCPDGIEVYVNRLIELQRVKRSGRMAGGLDHSREDALIDELLQYVK